MPNPTTPNDDLKGVIGTDNHAPVIDTDSRWKQWEINEIYRGFEGRNKYVPKPRDLVYNVATGEIFEVIDIDQATLIARLQPWKQVDALDPSNQEDFYLGVGPNRFGETYRMFIDKSTMPYEVSIDKRNMIGSETARYAKVYRGLAADSSHEVISMVYDGAGNFLGNEIPLKLVALSNAQNLSVYTTRNFKTTFDLPDNEPVTLMYFDDNGHVTSQQLLIVQNTGFINAGADNLKYITNISMESPYLSKTEPNVLEYPINLTINSSVMIGVVHYSDGSVVKFPAGGPHFDLMGLSDFISGIVNQEHDFDLRYTLRPNEITYGSVTTLDPFIVRPYIMRSTQAKNIYSVKLFCYPVWVDAVTGYRLAWFMFNLERKTWERVDTLIEYNTDTNAPFDPLAYGYTQRISVTIDLGRVSSTYKTYRHTQVFEVVLVKQGTESATLWRVNDYGSQTIYGVDLMAQYQFINQNLKRMKIDIGAATQEEWLERLYYNTNPLVDKHIEVKPPAPTHFIVTSAHNRTGIERGIDDWDSVLEFQDTLGVVDTVFVRFIRKTPDNDLQLSVAGVPITQVDLITG